VTLVLHYAGTNYWITRADCVIGRSGSCTRVVPEAGVSRHHCRIRREGDAYLLADLGSQNGTFVNERRIVARERPLVPGDTIRLGHVQIRAIELAEVDEVQTPASVRIRAAGDEPTTPLASLPAASPGPSWNPHSGVFRRDGVAGEDTRGTTAQDPADGDFAGDAALERATGRPCG
jgi:pSer/pThr/pTyr-binding forkhead associated (FHA) protein